MLHLSGVCRMPPNFFFFYKMTWFSESAVEVEVPIHARRPRKRDAGIGRGQYAHIQALFATLLRKFKTQLRKYEGKA